MASAIINNKFDEIRLRSQYDQQTEQWYRIRHAILTASNIASVLEANPYFTKTELLLDKCKPYGESVLEKNVASDWGIKYEGVAIGIYEELYEERIHKVGLLIHREFKWLGASPDGLRESGKLLEIKNVWNRRITPEVPLYYWIQVQIQLEVCDAEECDLFQCKIVEYETEEEYNNDMNVIKKGIQGDGCYWKLEKYSKNTIHRDRKWFRESALPLLETFYKDLEYYRTNQRYKQLIKKRKRNDDNGVCRDMLDYTQQNWNQWVGAGEVRNYILNDCIIDWLNAYDHPYRRDTVANHMNDVMNLTENSFKKNILKDLMDRFDTVWIGNFNEKFSLHKARLTIDEMKKGTPIIINGILHNYTNETYAIPDLIVRSDYLNRLTNHRVIVSDDAVVSSSSKHHQYKIVQIHYTTIEVNDDDNGVIVNTANTKIYKAEATVANAALNKLFGWNVEDAYLISRKWKIGKDKRNWMGYLGTIDCTVMAEESAAAIDWMKKVKSGKAEMGCPNMCNSADYPWHRAKKEIALAMGEITLLWNCGVKQRQMLNEMGINHWKDVKPILIDFKDNRAAILQEIIDINHPTRCAGMMINDFPKLSKKKTTEFGKIFYIDFETVNEIQYDLNFEPIEEMIYMIGLGWVQNNAWNFQTFIVDRLDAESEEKMINEWFRKMDQLSAGKKYTVMHWSNAEQTMLKKSLKRHHLDAPKNMNWFDLLKYYKDNCIAVRGAFHFGLKTIANACYTNGLIDVKWEDNDVDGAKAMITAWKCHRNLNNGDKMANCMEMQEIIRYNEIDCKVLWKLQRLVSSQK